MEGTQYSPRQVSATVNWSGTTLITFDMELTGVIFDRNFVVWIQMYLLNQFREFLISLKVRLWGVPLACTVPFAWRHCTNYRVITCKDQSSFVIIAILYTYSGLLNPPNHQSEWTTGPTLIATSLSDSQKSQNFFTFHFDCWIIINSSTKQSKILIKTNQPLHTHISGVC